MTGGRFDIPIDERVLGKLKDRLVTILGRIIKSTTVSMWKAQVPFVSFSYLSIFDTKRISITEPGHFGIEEERMCEQCLPPSQSRQHPQWTGHTQMGL